MKTALWVSTILLFFSVTGKAQEINDLQHYLESHQVVIHQDQSGDLVYDKPVNSFLSQKMAGKEMFISGEGGSHSLLLNYKIWLLLLQYFADNNLKYCLDESARAWAMEDNAFLESKDFPPGVPERIKRFREQERRIYSNVGKYKHVGIDFERGEALHKQIQLLLKDKDATTLQKIYTVAPFTRDSQYVKLSPGKFRKFYRQLTTDFYKDSLQLKPLLGEDFGVYKYLVTNPNVNTPWTYRDADMATNVLNEIGAPDNKSVYLLTCGMAHSRPGIKKTLAAILTDSERLKNKITVMGLYCDDCSSDLEKVSSWSTPYIKGEILTAFQNAAKGDIVIYDFTGIPEKYSKLRDYGDLMVFARKQN